MFYHTPVLSKEINALIANEHKNIVDTTLGEGGHSVTFLQNGKNVLAFERDPIILEKAKARLDKYKNRIVYCNCNYSEISATLKENNFTPDFILFDLGISTFHYKGSKRGFTFNGKESLDMRLNPKLETAEYIINNYSERELADIFYIYGEEKRSFQIAKKICEVREQKAITKSCELAEIICKVKKKR